MNLRDLRSNCWSLNQPNQTIKKRVKKFCPIHVCKSDDELPKTAELAMPLLIIWQINFKKMEKNLYLHLENNSFLKSVNYFCCTGCLKLVIIFEHLETI